jgi:uncharacterized damage-inducible protein DinB
MPTPFESAQLNLQLYDLRREPVLREARTWFLTEFTPESFAELVAAVGGARNASFRMVLGYWDMAASLVTGGAIDGDAFRAAHGEVFLTFSKIHPFLAELRAATGEAEFCRHVEAVVLAAPDAVTIMARRRAAALAAAKTRAPGVQNRRPSSDVVSTISPPIHTMHPRTTEVLDYLDSSRSTLDRAVAELPASMRRRRPAPDRWSVAEILEHVTLVERRVEALLRDVIDQARATGVGREHGSGPVLPTVPIDQLLDRNVPLTARENAWPTGTQDARQAASELSKTQRALRQLLVDADGLALSEVVAPHPRLGPLNVYQWLVFVGAHEGRHTAQVHEVTAALSPA